MIVDSISFLQYLEAEGLLPEMTIDVVVTFPVDDVITVTYTVVMTGERLESFRKAFGAYLLAQQVEDISECLGDENYE